METPIEETQPRPRLADLVAQEVGEQRAVAALNAAYEAAAEPPAFDKRSATSNIGRRVAAKIQLAQQE